MTSAWDSSAAHNACSSWTQLTLTLSCVEKDIGIIRQKADQRVSKEAERVKLVNSRRVELEAKHKSYVQERLGDYHIQLELIRTQGEREVQEANVIEDDANSRIKFANNAVTEAEAKARILEKQVKRLHVLYEKSCVDHDRRLESVRNETDVRVHKKQEDTNRIVRGTGVYASEVQASMIDHIGSMEAATRTRIKDLGEESVKRSRFQDLYDVAVSHSRNETPGHEFDKAKIDILREWHASWELHTTDPVIPHDQVTPGMREVDSSLSTYDTIGAEDILETVKHRTILSSTCPDSPRMKEILGKHAMSRMSEDRAADSEATGRPRTAPG